MKQYPSLGGMARLAALIVLIVSLLTLAGCAIDPCTVDSTSPTCAVKQSEAKATISAIDDAQAMRSAQATIVIESTRSAAKAEGTRAAIQQQATRQVVDGEATKIAVEVGGVIEKSRAETAALPYSALFNVFVLWLLLPACACAAVVYFGQRFVKSFSVFVNRSLAKRVATVTYGQPNNLQIGYLLFDPLTDNPATFITAEGLVGNFLDLLNGRGVVQSLDVPDQMKLAAFVEAAKRTQAARIASATGSAPWSAHSTYALESAAPAAQSSPIAPPAESPWSVPTFAELLKTWRPSVDQMLLGINEAGQPRYCGLDGLLSTGVVGMPGSGKTTVLRFHYLQCRLVGARVVVLDLHRTIVKSLPGAEAFTRLEDINQSAVEICSLLEHRVDHDQYDEMPIMILVDEFNLLAPKSPEAVEAISRIILEGRKVRMYAMVSGQGLSANLFGGSTPRDALSSRFVLHTTTRQAGIIGLDRDALPWVVGLKKGSAIVEGPIDAEVLYIPNTTEADVRALLPASTFSSAPLRPLRATSDEAAYAEALRPAEVAREVASEVDPKRLKIAEMLRAGASRNAIIRACYDGCTGGDKYQRATAEINQIQKELLGGSHE